MVIAMGDRFVIEDDYMVRSVRQCKGCENDVGEVLVCRAYDRIPTKILANAIPCEHRIAKDENTDKQEGKQ